ncbi:MAG: retroviral-like aspartic protease family protein [Chloroflexi bacterium]|nr:retroviral-like aspartic protease family protein [Chloroflexota bacterium]
MGLTYLQVDIASPADPVVWTPVEFLIDSGASSSVVPTAMLERLGIRPVGTQAFRLANGEVITRRQGGAAFRYGGHTAVAPVVFGEEGDSNLLGVTTLEALGFALDPIRRELRPLPMLLA